MNRFKFRYWHTKENRYIYTQCDCLAIKNTILYSLIGKPNKNGWFETDIEKAYNDFEPIPEQCTGLSDKNGKLIYEGDIVLAKHSHKSRPGKFIVKWGQGGVFNTVTAGFWLFDFSPITLETARKGDDFPESSEIEIIGNIHEQKDNK